MSDYTRLVLVGEDNEWYSRHVNPTLEEDPMCEGCEPTRWDALIYGTEMYDDPELTSREYQTGGECCFCEDCLARDFLGIYGYDTEGNKIEPNGLSVVVLPKDFVQKTLRSHGG